MRLPAVALLLVTSLSACSDGPQRAEVVRTPAPTTTTTPSPPPITLPVACGRVGAALSTGMLSKYQPMKEFSAEIDRLRAGGNPRVQGAVELLADGISAMEDVLVREGDATRLLAARNVFVRGLERFADRCEAVGSSPTR